MQRTRHSRSLHSQTTRSGNIQRTALSETLEPRRLFAFGDFDTSWGSAGSVTTSFPQGSAEAHAIVVQPNGLPIVGGTSEHGEFTLVRYDHDGSPDPSFATNGIELRGNVGGNEVDGLEGVINGLALQSDGKIVAVGTFENTQGYHVGIILRFLSNGQPDTSFGTFDGATWMTPATNTNGGFNAIAIRPDGTFIAAGSEGTTTASGGWLAEFDSTGKFVTQAITSLPHGPVGSFASVGLMTNGYIVAAGPAVQAAVVVRYTSSLVVDSSFGIDGNGTVSVSPDSATAFQKMIIQPDNTIDLSFDHTNDADSLRYDIEQISADGKTAVDDLASEIATAVRAEVNVWASPLFSSAGTLVQVAVASDDADDIAGLEADEWTTGATRVSGAFPDSNYFSNDLNGVLRDAEGSTDNGMFVVGGTTPSNGTESFAVYKFLGDTLSTFNTISGTVFVDANNNGKQDSGEAHLAGARVYVDSNSNGQYDFPEQSALTDASGNYTLTGLPVGSTYKVGVVPTASDKYVSAPAGGFYSVALVAGSPFTGDVFGLSASAAAVNKISGLVYSDKNSNGVQDSGDLGVAGVTVYIDTNNDSKLSAGESSAVTDANGSYTLTTAGSGAVVIRQVVPATYSQTSPSGGLGIHVTLSDSSAFTNENFGDHNNKQSVTYYPVFGQVFSDTNKNGKLDTGEAGLAGVTIYNDANNNSKLDTGESSVVTAADGTYTFNFDSAGPSTGKLRQILPAGDTQTTPANNYGISITVGQANNKNQNFGDYVPPVASYTFTGTIFNDANKNGKQDSGEAGLAGWQIYNDANNNSVLDAGEVSTFTNASGAYSITLTGSGKVRQIRPANWSQTTPSNNYGYTATASSIKTGNNFGDYTAVKYLGTVATTSGLVAWWTFDGNANSVVNGYTGTLTGGATIASTGGAPVSGETSSSGLSLNGTSAFVDTNLTAQQQFATAATYNVWINLSAKPASGSVAAIVAKSVFGNDLDLLVASNGTISFYTDNGTSTTFTPASTTGWHMVTAEFDTVAKTRELFWDGQLVASTANYTGTHSANTGTLSIGESDVFTGRFFSGKEDEVSLWNRALTASEVLAIYNASK